MVIAARRTAMFTTENSEYSQGQCDEMNVAVKALMARGIDESNACDLVNNAVVEPPLSNNCGALVERALDALGVSPFDR
jgi:hypothetical protein